MLADPPLPPVYAPEETRHITQPREVHDVDTTERPDAITPPTSPAPTPTIERIVRTDPAVIPALSRPTQPREGADVRRSTRERRPPLTLSPCLRGQSHDVSSRR